LYFFHQLGTVARRLRRPSRIAKFAIDDDLWALIEPLLPKRRPRNRRYAGRKPIPDRAALTGILFVLRSGLPWNMLPREMGCGSGTTCWRRLVRWQRAGVWKRLHAVLLAELHRRGDLDLARAVVDSSSLRALRGGKKLDRTLPIAARPGRSIMFSPTRTGFRSSRR
jgi:transposase